MYEKNGKKKEIRSRRQAVKAESWKHFFFLFSFFFRDDAVDCKKNKGQKKKNTNWVWRGIKARKKKKSYKHVDAYNNNEYAEWMCRECELCLTIFEMWTEMKKKKKEEGWQEEDVQYSTFYGIGEKERKERKKRKRTSTLIIHRRLQTASCDQYLWLSRNFFSKEWVHAAAVDDVDAWMKRIKHKRGTNTNAMRRCFFLACL